MSIPCLASVTPSGLLVFDDGTELLIPRVAREVTVIPDESGDYWVIHFRQRGAQFPNGVVAHGGPLRRGDSLQRVCDFLARHDPLGPGDRAGLRVPKTAEELAGGRAAPDWVEADAWPHGAQGDAP